MNTIQPPVAARPTLSRDLDRSLVKVESDKGRLRLRFTYRGTRHYIAVGLPDSRVNRIVAQQKATQIELDIASGNFDETLKKYKPPKATARKREATTVAGLFEEFTAVQTKAKDLQVGSLCRYGATQRHLDTFILN